MAANLQRPAIYFASHIDGATDNQWDVSTALGPPYGGDDHLNLKSLEGDPAAFSRPSRPVPTGPTTR